MNKAIAAILVAGSMSLGACADNYGNDTLESAGTGAAAGAAVGAGVGAVVGGISPITGAAIGAAVGGVAGAVWADNDDDGRADGYVREGRYYEGTPSGYYAGTARECPSTLGSAATGAAGGAAVGAGAGALLGGVGILEGAAIGAAVGGVAGAIWADSNDDGCIDGYVREGRYYEGAPTTNTTPAYQAPMSQGERG